MRMPNCVMPSRAIGRRSRVNETEAGLRVDLAGGDEHAVGPERDLAIAGLPREAHAFCDQSCADPQAARLRMDDQEPQLADRLRLRDEEDGADDLAVHL